MNRQWLCVDELGRYPRLPGGCSARIIARRRPCIGVEPADDRPKAGLIRGDLRRADLVRSLARGVAAQRRRRRADAGGGGARSCGTGARAASRGGLSRAQRYRARLGRRMGWRLSGSLSRPVERNRIAADLDPRARQILGDGQSRPPGRRSRVAPRRARRRKPLRVEGRRDRLRGLPANRCRPRHALEARDG